MLNPKALLLILFAFIATVCNAQSAETDSLFKLIATAKQDSTKADLLISLSKAYLSTSTNDAIKYATEAKVLSEKIGYKKGVAYALKNIGLGYWLISKYDLTLDYWQQSLAAFSAMNDKAGMANILSNLGAIYFNQADATNALEYYLKALKVAEEINDSLRLATVYNNIGAIYAEKEQTLDKAKENYLKALPIGEKIQDKGVIGNANVNLGEIYYKKNKLDSALFYFEESLKAYENSENKPYSLTYIGKVYALRGDYDKAIKVQQEAFEFAKKLDAQFDMAQARIGLAETYVQLGKINLALEAYLEAEKISKELKANKELKDCYAGLAQSYAELSDYSNAYKYQTLYSVIKDTLYNIETDKKLGSMDFAFKIAKKEAQIDLLTKDKALQELDLQKQKFAKNALMVGLVLIFIIAFILFRNNQQKIRTNRILDRQKAEIETLLHNILPVEVAQELQRDGHATPRYYEKVSVLFTDFKGFTTIAEGMAPNDLVDELSAFFTAFDDIVTKYNIEKIKTIGDAFMCAGGIPSIDDSHPYKIIKAAMEIQKFMTEHNKKRLAEGKQIWQLRIGIHTGPVVAGVVGKKKYAYDIWGNTVNIASRMESNGEPGKVNVSNATYNLIKDQFECTYRGKISAKNIGEIDMYFVGDEIGKAELVA